MPAEGAYQRLFSHSLAREWFLFMAGWAVVLVNGEIEQPALIAARLANCGEALVIAADRGSRHAGPLGLRLDAIVGDLDSISAEERAAFEREGVAFEVSSPEKDETDLELALLYAINKGMRHIVCIGMLGGRLDMAVANLFLLMHPALTAARVELWDGTQTAWLIRPPGDAVPGQPGDTLSLIPLAGSAVGVTTHQMKYPLVAETLVPGPARGVSNVLLEAGAHVDLTEGCLLAVHTPGRA
jgi:thiamine pyrophosphokinase